MGSAADQSRRGFPTSDGVIGFNLELMVIPKDGGRRVTCKRLVVAALLAAAINCCAAQPSVSTRETFPEIKAGKRWTLRGLISPHASMPAYVRIHGTTYLNARGLFPYYIYLPDLKSVLFVTDDGRATGVEIHVVETGTGKANLTFECGDIGFGYHLAIGPELPGSADVDYVESISADAIILASSRSLVGRKEIYVLSRTKGRLVRIESFSYDKNGNVSRHDVRQL